MLLQSTSVYSDLCGPLTWQLLLWLLGAFLLGLLLGWFLWSKWKSMYNDSQADLASWKAKANGFEADLSSLRYEKEKVDVALKDCKRKSADLDIKLKACEEAKAALSSGVDSGGGENLASAALGFAAGNVAAGGGALTGYGAILKEDNLQVVEGIGPKIKGLLKDAGITTWAALAAAAPEKLSEILNAAGPRYRIHDPKTWPKQASLANEGKWDELIEYQKFLGGGKEDSNIGGGQAKVEKLYMKAQGLKAFDPNDLKVVEGIGPKIEGLLKDAGIDTWAKLAESSADRIREILKAAGDRYRLADPETWPRQAQLANEGKWAELKEYQDFLQGGKA